MPDRPQIIQPLDVQIARAVTRIIPGGAPVRGAGSPLTAIRVDGLEPCSIVDAGVTRFLRRLRRTQTRTLGFTRTRGSLWYPGAGTLPALSALRELLPRGGLVRGSVVSVAEFGVLALALLAGASADRAWCGIAGVPVAGIVAAAELAWTSSGRCWSRISGTPGRRWWRRCSAGARSSWCDRPGRPRLRSGSAWRRCSGAGGACCLSRATGRACRRAYGSPRGGGADPATGTGGCGRASRR